MSGEKRSQDCEDTVNTETAIIVDIEGTTTSISFVKETLFPYVKENLKQYIEKKWDTEEFKKDLEKLKEQAKKDENDKIDGVVLITDSTPDEEKESLIKNVLWQMNSDRKTGALKQLQGRIWREAYESGAVKGHVYEDVPKAFEAWTQSGRKIYVFSSGSVEAQKLLFGHSQHGDMLKYFSGYFDTDVGAKRDASSYQNILGKIEAEPSNVLFLTDVAEEAQAARKAGISTKIVIRPGNGPLTDEEKVTFTTIESFLDLCFQKSTKRQKVEKPLEKEAAESKTLIPEPMDTSDEATKISSENTPKKENEKMEESKKPSSETPKIEENKISVKGESDNMEIDGKVETEKLTPEISDKPSDEEEAAKTKKTKSEEETKVEIEATKEATAAGQIVKKDGEVCKKDAEPAKNDVETVKKDIGIEEKKDGGETMSANNENAKKVCEAMIKDDESSSKRESEASKTEETVAAATGKLDDEPMDENSTSAKSKTVFTKTEDKTEVTADAAESMQTDAKPETEAKKEIEGGAETIVKKNEVEEKKVVDATSAAVSGGAEKEIDGKTTSMEKIEPEIIPKGTDNAPAKESDEKIAKVDEKMKEGAKENGDGAKNDAAQSTEKKESNGESKDENCKDDKVVAAAAAVVAASETTKATPAVEKVDEKIEPALETAKKEETTKIEAKSKIDESSTAADSTDAKLNGTAKNTNKDENEKPHRNGLNGDSKNEAGTVAPSSSQNGEAESSTDSAATSSAESIKAKKVVDSTIVDGAGEPEVVPPVAVAATS